MKIRFKKKRFYMSLFIGFFPIAGGIYGLLAFDDSKYIYYLIAGLIIIGEGLYNLKAGYLKIDNRIIKKNVFFGFGNKINLNKVISLENKENKYILRTESKKLKISTELINEKSLTELNEILERLNLSPKKASCQQSV